MFFHFSELLDPKKEVKTHEEVEFTVTQVTVHKTGSTWYKVFYQHTMYVMGIYQLRQFNVKKTDIFNKQNKSPTVYQ
jgi:hypothetical protein